LTSAIPKLQCHVLPESTTVTSFKKFTKMHFTSKIATILERGYHVVLT